MKIQTLLKTLTLGAFVAFSLNIRAATITWGAATLISGDTDVSTTGTLRGAYSFNAGGGTLNGVVFTSVTSGTTFGTNFTISAAGTVYASFNGSGAPYTNLTTAYQTLLKNGRYGVKGTTITINNLTIARSYSVQVWVNDSRVAGGAPANAYVMLTSGANTVNLYINNTTLAGGVGQYVIGTFTADGPTQTFSLSSSWADCYINAIQLRDQGQGVLSTAGWWNGFNGSAWDSNTTANWSTNNSDAPLGSGTFSAAMVLSGGIADFKDFYFSNSVAIPVTQNSVAIAAGGVSATTVNFSSSSINYTLSSADATGLSGATAVNKSGSSTVTFASGNTYSGATTITGGALTLGDINAVSNSTVTVGVASGLKFGTGITTSVLGGLAGSSSFALTNVSGTPVTLLVGNNGASTSYSGVLSGTNGGLTKIGGGNLTLTATETLTGAVTVNAGNLLAHGPSANGNFYKAASVTVNNGGTLTSGANGLFGYNNNPVPVVVNAGGTMTVDGGTGGGPNIFGTITLAGGTLADGNSLHPTYGSYNFGGPSIIATGNTTSLFSARDFQFRNAVTVQVDSGSILNVTGYFTPLSHTGNQTLTKTGAGKLILAGVNTHGATVVSNGTVEVSGSLPAYTLTVKTNATLTGSGTINGPTTIQAGGTLTLGTTNIATLYMYSTLNLAGNVILKITKDGGFASCDNISGMSGVTYGGTLTVTNITSDTNLLANGNTFTLFTKYSGTYNGSFGVRNLPPLPTGLFWDVSGLATSGSIAVTDVTPAPTFNPSSGGYVGALSVVISGVPGSTVFYTTNGSLPDNTSANGGVGTGSATVIVPVDTYPAMDIKAYATNSGSTDSSVASANYSTISAPVWTSLYGGSWSGGYNWSNNVVATGVGVTANFSQLTLTGDEYVFLDGANTIGNMIFGDVGGAYNWDVATGSGGPLTLDNGTNSPVITVLTNTTTLGVVLAGPNGLTKTGNGTLALTTNEAYTGNTIVNGGVLRVSGGGAAFNNSTLQGILTVNSGATCSLGSPNAFGSGGGGVTDVYLNGGTFTGPNSCNALGISYHLSGGTISNTGSIRMGVQTGYPDVTLTSSSNSVTSVVAPIGGLSLYPTFGQYVFVVTTEKGTTPSGVDMRIDTAISQTAAGCSIVKTGAGTMALNGVNTYTGSTTVSNGTLLLNGSLAAGSAVIVTPSGILGGTGTVNGALTNSGTLAPGASVGTLTSSNQTWNAGAAYAFQFDSATNSAGWDLLNINGTLDIQATVGSPVILKLVSMSNATTPGLVPDFDGNTSYTWVVAMTSGGLLNFDASKFAIDASAFANSHTGTFSVDVQGNSLVVKYTSSVLTPPTLSGGEALGGGQFALTFSGPNGQTYTVLTSTNVALPLVSWNVLTTGTFGGNPVIYTNTTATNGAQFYIIQSP